MLATSPAGRIEVTNSPTVGIVHSTVITMTTNDAIGLLNERRIALPAGTHAASAGVVGGGRASFGGHRTSRSLRSWTML